MSEEPPIAEPSIDEVVQAIRAMRVSDLLQLTTFTFAQLAFAKLDEPTRDLDEARLAIESLRALLPLAESPSELSSPRHEADPPVRLPG